jgi:hypothetical protein
MDNRAQLIKNAERMPRKSGKAEYIRFLKGQKLTRGEAIKATCFECIGGEDTRPCNIPLCPLTQYCQFNGDREVNAESER